jgi:hypothetical protein
MYTPQTAASIVTASKFAPPTQEQTLSENGVTAGARRAITFSSDQFFSERCVWARTLQTSGRARQPNRKVQPQLKAEVQRHHQLAQF